jgi:hypothetical protein
MLSYLKLRSFLIDRVIQEEGLYEGTKHTKYRKETRGEHWLDIL